MLSELDTLRDRIEALATSLHRLRLENRNLRESLRTSQSQAKDLQTRIDQASQRIESILQPRSEA